MNFQEFQLEVLEWQLQNFPDSKPYQPLLGLQEEVGELAHAHLKMEQGIRGSMAEHMAAKKDAVGDILIFLANYCCHNGIDMGEAVQETWDKVKQRRRETWGS
jgi:NTP pyrophosphatase (non-canonical NTP hydrolase)